MDQPTDEPSSNVNIAAGTEYTPDTVTLADGNTIPFQLDIVRHYFDHETYNKVLNMGHRDRYFQMVTEYVDILYDIYGGLHNPLLDHVRGTPLESIKKSMANTTPGLEADIDYDRLNALIGAYDEWRNRRA